MSFALVLLALLLVGIWVLSPPDRLPGRFTQGDCRTMALTGPDGAPIVGIEDIALIADTGELILSAHDRSDPLADGGLYRVTLFELGAGDELEVERISPIPDPGTRFRPHGIAVSPAGDRLALVNRTGEGEAQVEIGALTPEGWELDRKLTGETLCRANDLAFTGGLNDTMVISLDRADCTTSLRDLWPGASTGRIARFDGQRLVISRGRLSFPNGLVGPYIAETRADRVLRPGAAPIMLPGGPDNLSLDQEDNLIAAVHPAPVHLWLYLNDWQERAPSRILRINPVTSEIESLFDDPSGQIFSAATSAIMWDEMLVAGSVRDAGLLVCSKDAL